MVRYLPEEYAAGKANLEAERFWKARQCLKYYQVAEKLCRKHFPKAASFLDVGGASSRFLDRFKGKRAVADVKKDGNIYLVSSNVNYLVTDGTLKRFKDNSFDVVFALQVIEHGSLEASELFRVAKLGAIISYPHMWSAGTDHHRKLDKAWFIEKVGREPDELVIAHDSRLRGVGVFKTS